MVFEREAEIAVADALRALDTVRSVQARVPHRDLDVRFDDGGRIGIEVTAVAHPRAAEIDAWVRRRRRRTGKAGELIPLLVADQLAAGARRMLRDAGWGYFDRRGHLVLPVHGRTIEAVVPPRPRLRVARGVPRLDSKGALAVGLGHLMAPTGEPPGVRQLAALGGLSPSTVSTARAALVDAGLLDSQHRPAVPDLFWELARAWRPEWHPVRRPFDSDDRRLQALVPLGLDGPFAPDDGRLDPGAGDGGVALSGFVAASRLTTVAVVTDQTPLDVYVPDEAALRRAVHYLEPGSVAERAASLAVAPSALVTAVRRAPASGLPYAHDVVVALDLAQDRGRGHEVLQALDAWWLGSRGDA